MIFCSIVSSLQFSHLHIPTAGIRMGGCKLCIQEIEASSEQFGILVQCILCKVWLTDYSIQTLLNSIRYRGLGLQFFLIPLTIPIQSCSITYSDTWRFLFPFSFSFSSLIYGLRHIAVCICALCTLYIPMTRDSRLSICLHEGLVLDAGCIDCYLYKSPPAPLQKKE